MIALAYVLFYSSALVINMEKHKKNTVLFIFVGRLVFIFIGRLAGQPT